MRNLIAGTVVLFVLGIDPTNAQQVDPAAAAECGAFLLKANDPRLVSPTRVDAPADANASHALSGALVLETKKENEEVTGQVAWARKGLDTWSQWRITLTGPLNKSEPTTRLASLDGLTGKARATAGAAWLFLPGKLLCRPKPADYCRTILGDSAGCQRTCAKFAAGAEESQDCLNFCARGQAACVGITGSLQLPNALQRDFAKKYLSGFNTLGFDATVAARQKFEFADANTLAEAKAQEHTSYSLSAGAGRLFVAHPFVYSAGIRFRYEESFAAATTKREICRPHASGNEVCGETVLGAPSRKLANIITVEARLYPTWGGRQSGLGIYPAVSYDIKDDGLGVEIPILFLRGAGGELTGGVIAGWVSDPGKNEESYTLSAVIGFRRDLFSGF